MATKIRKNIHIPAQIMTYLATANRSLSSRVASIVDRYREAMRRSEPIEGIFTPAQRRVIIKATRDLNLDPAVRLYCDEILMLVEENGGREDLLDTLRDLTPWQQIQLAEWIETDREQ